MPWQVEPLTLPLALSGALGLAVAAVVWRERPKAGATWLSFTALAVAAWAFGQVAVVSHTGEAVRMLGSGVTVAGMVFTPPLWLFFSLAYTGRADRATPLVIALLLLEPTVLSALALVGHDLVFAPGTLAAGAAGATLFETYGPLLVAQHAWGYGLLFVSEVLLVRMFLGSRNVFRKRTFFLLTLIVTLHACQFLSIAGLSPTPYQTLTPLGFLLFGALSLLALVSYRSYEFLPLKRVMRLAGRHSKSVTPIARERAIEQMATGFLVIDHAGRIVDINPMGKRILAREGDRVVGKSVSTVIPPEIFVDGAPAFFDPAETAAIHGSGRYTGIWVDPPGGEQRCFDVLVTRLGEDAASGTVALIHDVTERERRKGRLRDQNRELKRQNEQLDNFASIVSHDLRNPLTVADGRLELIERETDSEHVRPARVALDRMRQIIDDVLQIARSGQSVSEAEPVALDECAEEAWETVDTRSATLRVDLKRVVAGDRSRILRMFENFFRNAVEHGGDDVTVTVGDCEDGFFVADDGPGIPPDHRDQILDEGFTTSEDGTGFGLTIIQTIVEAHGWDLAVATTASDGARFEITGDALATEQDVPAVAK